MARPVTCKTMEELSNRAGLYAASEIKRVSEVISRRGQWTDAEYLQLLRETLESAWAIGYFSARDDLDAEACRRDPPRVRK